MNDWIPVERVNLRQRRVGPRALTTEEMVRRRHLQVWLHAVKRCSRCHQRKPIHRFYLPGIIQNYDCIDCTLQRARSHKARS
jgi:hypothetical protein